MSATARLALTQSRRKGIEQAFDKTVGCRLGFRPEMGRESNHSRCNSHLNFINGLPLKQWS